MYKKVIGSLLLLLLIGVFIYNVTEQKTSSNTSNQMDVTSDSNVEGTTIVSPGADSGIDVGEKAPNFSLKTLDGEQVTLSDYKGKKVFLNFWATWCGPCRVEMPEMEEFQEQYGDEVEIIAVNATGAGNETIDDVEKFLNQGNFSFTVLLDHDSEVTDDYKLVGIPTTYFIGTDGYIQGDRKVGPMTFELMEEMMEKLN